MNWGDHELTIQTPSGVFCIPQADLESYRIVGDDDVQAFQMSSLVRERGELALGSSRVFAVEILHAAQSGDYLVATVILTTLGE